MLKKFFSTVKSHIFAAFIPWIFFGVFYGTNKDSILFSTLGSVILMVVFNFRELKKGFILPWGSIILFAFLFINGLHEFILLSPIAAVRLINSALAAIVLFSLIIGKPFTLQYAKEEVDSKYWRSPAFLKINWILTIIWAILMIIMALSSYFLTYEQIQSSWFWNYGLMILCIVVGMRCNRTIPKLMRK